MFTLKIITYILLGLLLSNCAVNPAKLDAGHELPLKNIAVPEITKREDEELRDLTKMSDLIITGKVVEVNQLVDPQKMKEEFEKSEGKKLPNIQSFMKGYVYKVAVSTRVYGQNRNNKPETVSIYAPGDPFSLHSTLVRLTKDGEYLIFLSSAQEEDIVKGLTVADSEDLSKTAEVDYKSVFLVNGGSKGVRLLKEDPEIINKIKKLVEEEKNKKAKSPKDTE